MALAKKPSGFSAVYSSLTGVVVSTAETANELVSAGQVLAGNAHIQAMVSRVESSNSLLEAMGVDVTEMDPTTKIANAASLMQALRNM